MTTIRRILHCDMDCFYAAVHMRDDPSLRGKPVVIGGRPEGRGVVAAASYEARAYGIHSAMPSARAKRLCSDVVFVRPEFPRYREESKEIFALLRGYTPVVQPVSIDEAFLDVTDHLGGFASATAVAQDVRRRIRAERGLTVSIGVGPNRLIAKIASDRNKPDGLTVVSPKKVRRFLDPLPVRCLPGVGPVTADKLTQRGWRTVSDLRNAPEPLLREVMGRHGEMIYRYAHGVDDRPVRTTTVRKSVSSENTYAEDLTSLEEMDEKLGKLIASVVRVLDRRELMGSTATVKVRFADFQTVTRSLTLPAPTRDATRLGEVAAVLLRRTEADERPIRLLGFGVANLVHGSAEQLSLLW